jgi:hypothetical protein
MTERYLVLKGMAGFGDRLMTLGRAIVLARATGRKLVVDWTDVTWNHVWPNPCGFFHYFALIGEAAEVLAVDSDEEVITLLTELNTESSVVPPVFRGNLVRSNVEFNHSTKRMELRGQPTRLPEDQLVRSDARVVIYMAYNAGRFEDVLPFLRFRAVAETPRSTIGVHFRNTDKTNDIGDTLARTKAMWKPGRSVFLATDDMNAIATFRSLFGDDLVCSEPPGRPASGGGIHHALPEELAAVGITKESLNCLMIRDVLALRSAVIFIDCPNSLFSQIVWFLRRMK